MHATKVSRSLALIVVSAIPLPEYFFEEVLGPEHGVHQDLQIMASGRVAVQINRTCDLEHPTQLDEARRHHRNIGHHVGVKEERSEGPHNITYAAALLDDF